MKTGPSALAEGVLAEVPYCAQCLFVCVVYSYCAIFVSVLALFPSIPVIAPICYS